MRLRKKDGSYPNGSIFALVDERLKTLAQGLANFGKDEDRKSVV